MDPNIIFIIFCLIVAWFISRPKNYRVRGLPDDRVVSRSGGIEHYEAVRDELTVDEDDGFSLNIPTFKPVGFDFALQGIIFLGVAAILAAIFVKILVGFKENETEFDINDTIDSVLLSTEELTGFFQTIAMVVAGIIILSLVFVVVNIGKGVSEVGHEDRVVSRSGGIEHYENVRDRLTLNRGGRGRRR